MRSKLIIALLAVPLLLLGCTISSLLDNRSEDGVDDTPPSLTADPTQVSTKTTNTAQDNGALVQPADFNYLGAFRLPGDEDRPRTFAYGGNAMTFNPDGDANGANDGFPGSLFVMGHDRIPYGELPDGNQVAEINIPVPKTGKDLEALNSAGFLQGFANVAKGAFSTMDEIPKTGMAYLDTPETGPLIHLAWGAHLQPPDTASHAWFSPDLSNPDMQGFWFIGNQDLYSVNGYLFEIPAEWAQAHVGGRVLATGRMRDGGQGGMGPELFAYRPWQEDGSPATNNTHLEEITLLLYESSYNTEEITRCLDGYQFADEWEGGAWLSTQDGRSAVIFAGTKATGDRTWYGYVHPDGADKVCVDTNITDFPTCRTADGGICPVSETRGCCDEESGACISMRGWWSSRFDAQIILYNPADLALVAEGKLETWEPQPYAVVDIDEYLYLSPPEWEQLMLGSGDQRRYRIGDVAFDRANGLLYVLELYADGGKPLVHVWQIN